jgi:hypothetical protein
VPFVFERVVGGTGHYLNRSADREGSVLALIRAYAATVTLATLGGIHSWAQAYARLARVAEAVGL